MRSFHYVIERLGNSSNHLKAFPIRENRKNPSQTDSWDVLLMENGLQTSTKFFIYLLGSSWANPPNSPLNYKSCNMVLAIRNTTFLLARDKWMTQTPSTRFRSLTFGSLISLRFLISSWWTIWLPLLPLTLVSSVSIVTHKPKIKISIFNYDKKE